MRARLDVQQKSLQPLAALSELSVLQFGCQNVRVAVVRSHIAV